MRRVLMVTIAAAAVLLSTAPAVSAWPATTPVGSPRATLQSARNLLAGQRASNAFPSYSTYYLDVALSRLDAALQGDYWTVEQPRGNPSGLAALDLMWQALASLTWGDIAIRDATDTAQSEITSAMAGAAHARFYSVFHFIGEGGGPTDWTLWAAEYHLTQGDNEPWYTNAGLEYIASFRQLTYAGPCC
jgi:hypothetical protein